MFALTVSNHFACPVTDSYVLGEAPYIVTKILDGGNSTKVESISSVIFEPLALLISVNVLLRLTSAVTQPFGENKISDFLSQTADDLNYCTAGILLSAFMYLLCIVIAICTTEMML